MYGVCLQTKPSKTVHSFMCDICMNAYGVKLKKSIVLIGYKLSPRTFLPCSKFCENFEGF